MKYLYIIMGIFLFIMGCLHIERGDTSLLRSAFDIVIGIALIVIYLNEK